MKEEFRTIAESFIRERQSKWKGLPADAADVEVLKTKPAEIARQVPVLILSDDDSLMAEMMLRYFRDYIDKTDLTRFETFAQDAAERFPLIKDLRRTIGSIHDELLQFFVSYGLDYDKDEKVFRIPWFNNQLADSILEMECERIRTDQETRELSPTTSNPNFITQFMGDERFMYGWLSKKGEQKSLEEIQSMFDSDQKAKKGESLDVGNN